jgi:hypothetical protein
MNNREVYIEGIGEIERGIRLIKNAWVINIEITNYCVMGCSNCTRATKHIINPQFSSLEFIEKALNSLKDFPRGIGIIGGEPQDHPEWDKICKLLEAFNHVGGYILFTSRELDPKYHHIFNSGRIYITDHGIKNLHHPLLIALEEVVPDKKLQRELIEKCWLQRLWSPSIFPKGAFWCEIAGVLDMMYDGPGGYEINSDWWKNEFYEDQIERWCVKCGICVPVDVETDHEPLELVTPKVLERLKALGSPHLDKLKLYTDTLSIEDIRYRQERMVSPCYITDRIKEHSNVYF